MATLRPHLAVQTIAVISLLRLPVLQPLRLQTQAKSRGQGGPASRTSPLQASDGRKDASGLALLRSDDRRPEIEAPV